MKLSRHAIDEFALVEVSGIVDSNAAGPLCGMLVECVGDGCKKLIVDLSGVTHVTHAGARGLIVAAKLLRSGGGEMRVCTARPAAEEMLRGLGFHHLLKCDPTVEHSIIALSGSAAGLNRATRAA